MDRSFAKFFRHAILAAEGLYVVHWGESNKEDHDKARDMIEQNHEVLNKLEVCLCVDDDEMDD